MSYRPVCSFCGDELNRPSVDMREDSGKLVLCETCFWVHIYDAERCTKCGASAGIEQHILGNGKDGLPVVLCDACYQEEMTLLYHEVNQ